MNSDVASALGCILAIMGAIGMWVAVPNAGWIFAAGILLLVVSVIAEGLKR